MKFLIKDKPQKNNGAGIETESLYVEYGSDFKSEWNKLKQNSMYSKLESAIIL